MPAFEFAALAVSAALLALIAARLLWIAAAQAARPGAMLRNRDGSFGVACANCGASTAVQAEDLAPLSSAEKALAVRERPSALGQDLAEFVCPYCDAAHCFSIRRDDVVLVGINLYQGQRTQASCKECRKPLLQPPWPRGTFDGRVDEAPGNTSELGLACAHCGAICCGACCRTATRNRTADHSLLCPRCFRGPVDHFHHPGPANRMEPAGGSGY